ncbi:Mak10-domain-containing protein [Annulohypoxylon maeteangense]|uniref:Mak10-domain-containing protein n=1 Tax=Annulohypoxylon maeteangense TaxID=1927788 RepID=UPI00200739FE|nr:Mak10-domain-containing protein [Annulohypoxylon maeteangense]KAI0884498.1 Mak10-domain-containing protein [Annulohypoxylon maeteangense]
MQYLDPLSPPPNVSHPGVMATNITEKFASAVKTLAPGELVKDDHFTLFESVAALEVMDPKMDSGVLAEGESLDQEYDVSRDLLPEEILGIIDQLLCLEMAWHQGYPLSQTLFTSVYIESLMKPRPTNIDEADFIRDSQSRERQPKFLFILRAYCLGLLKACCFVNELVKEELYYEEEDFVTNTYDRNLLFDLPLASINSLLLKARSDLRLASNDIPKEISAALELRLELRIAFLRAIDLASLRRNNPDSLKMPWTQMSGLIEHIKRQHELGKPVPEAFSTKLQRRLASTMPPRPMVQPSFEESYGHFKRLFEDGVDIMDVLKYTEPQSLLNFVLLFQARKPQPLVYIRTLLQSMICKDMIVLGSYSIRQILDHDLSIVVLPCAPQIDRSYDAIEVPTDPRHQISAQMEIFRQRAAECYLEIFRIFCQNRCRVRRTLCHNIQEWEMLQGDVEEIDQLLQNVLDEKPLTISGGDVNFSLPLSSWAYLYKLRQMEWIVQLGFELETYQTDELAGMYWYLNYLAKTRAQHGDRIKAFTMRSLNEARDGLAGSSDQLSQYTAAKDREYMTSLAYLRVTMLDAACTWEFADGLCCLYTALQRLNLISLPQRPYSSDTLRYDLRMKPFRGISLPALPTFDEFTRATLQPETATHDLLKYAENAVGGARKGYEALSRMSEAQTFSANTHDRWVVNIKDCLKAAIAAGVAVSTLQRALDRARSREDQVALKLGLKVEMPETGKGYHDWWIVPKLIPTA